MRGTHNAEKCRGRSRSQTGFPGKADFLASSGIYCNHLASNYRGPYSEERLASPSLPPPLPTGWRMEHAALKQAYAKLLFTPLGSRDDLFSRVTICKHWLECLASERVEAKVPSYSWERSKSVGGSLCVLNKVRETLGENARNRADVIRETTVGSTQLCGFKQGRQAGAWWIWVQILFP